MAFIQNVVTIELAVVGGCGLPEGVSVFVVQTVSGLPPAMSRLEGDLIALEWHGCNIRFECYIYYCLDDYARPAPVVILVCCSIASVFRADYSRKCDDIRRCCIGLNSVELHFRGDIHRSG